MSIVLKKSIRIAGAEVAAGPTVLSYSAELEADLVSRGHAVYVTPPAIVNPVTPSADYAAAVVGAAGVARSAYKAVLFGDSMLQYHQYFWFGSSAVTALSRTGNVATSTIAGHGMQTGRMIRVINAGSFNYEGPVTRVDANTISYPSEGLNGAADRSSISVIDREFVSSQSAFLWANSLLGGSMVLTKNMAVGGQTTAQMLARIGEVIAQAADIIIVLGTYNDIGVLSPAETVSNLTEIYKLLAATGATVVAVTAIPLSSAGPKWSAANVEHVLAVNRAIRAVPRTIKQVVVADAFRKLVDKHNTTNRGTALAGVLDADNVHPLARGQFLIGRSIYDALTDRIARLNWSGPTCAAECAAAGVSNYNAIDNAPNSTSGGTVSAPATGTAATGITVERASGATGECSASVVTDTDGTYMQRISVTPGGAETWNIRSNTGGTIVTRLTSGERRRLSMRVKVGGLATGHTLTGLLAFVAITADGVTYYHYIGRNFTVLPIDADGAYTLVSEPMSVPAGAITNAGWTVQATFGGAFATPINIDVGDVGWVQTSDLPA